MGNRDDVTGVFCTSGSEREFTLKERWYANQEIQAGVDCGAARKLAVEIASGRTTPQACKETQITAQTYYR
jgi:hypothetical protein